MTEWTLVLVGCIVGLVLGSMRRQMRIDDEAWRWRCLYVREREQREHWQERCRQRQEEWDG